MVLVDFIRYHQQLTGTKIGCREGDCGACSVLTGELKEDRVEYRAVTSCLMPLGNAQRKHVVTIEGINMDGLNALQQFMCDESATQCGFCTPGIVMSLAGFCLHSDTTFPPSTENVIMAIDGNICRCTGYKSIERAAWRVADLMSQRQGEEPVHFLTSRFILPAYFKDIKERLSLLPGIADDIESNVGAQRLISIKHETKLVGGGTDLYVQQHNAMAHSDISFMSGRSALNGIVQQNNTCIMGASATVSDINGSPIFREHFPEIRRFIKLISSTPIRNMATIGGNFANASPIGDLTIFFLALNAQLILSDGRLTRELPLKKFYHGYKVLDKNPDEFIQRIWFELPDKNSFFNFEKVSKRTHLDIATVNTAMLITMQGETIKKAGLSAGGVGPVPLFLSKASSFLQGKRLSTDTILQAIELMQAEISPISDTRGGARYKRLLLNQLIKAHFITLFPSLEVDELLNV